VRKALGDSGALTARQLRQKLGVTGDEAARKLSGVLQELINEEEVYYKGKVELGGTSTGCVHDDGVVYCLL
jgi:hypothetical protein